VTNFLLKITKEKKKKKKKLFSKKVKKKKIIFFFKKKKNLKKWSINLRIFNIIFITKIFSNSIKNFYNY